MLQFDGAGLRRVISGGQTGADQAGLCVADAYDIETGGTAPLGWRTSAGPDPTLARYGLIEDASRDFKPRTIKNVQDADATIVLSRDFTSGGTVLTVATAKRLKKPLLCISLRDLTPEWVEKNADLLVKFLVAHQVEVLNVAGNRDPGDLSIFTAALSVLDAAFHQMKCANLLVPCLSSP